MKGELLALAALALFSTNIIVTRLATQRMALDAGYVLAVIVNIAFAALLVGIQLFVRADPPQWHWPGFLLFALGGVFSTYFGRWFMLESIARLGPARASAFQVSSPLFTLAFAWLFLEERLSLQSIVAILVTGMGLLLLSLSRTDLTRRTAVIEGTRRVRFRARVAALVRSGALIGAGASAAYAVSNVFRGAGIRAWDEAIAGALIGAVAGFAMQMAFGASPRTIVTALRNADRRGVILFALTGVLTISAQMLTITAMAFSPVAIVSLITLCTPVLVFPLSYFLLKNDEGLNARSAAGALLVLAGIAAIILR